MLSSQTPTIVAKDGKAFLVTGSPGGRTIINTVLCVVTNVIDFEMDVAGRGAMPRGSTTSGFRTSCNRRAVTDVVIKKLDALGHTVRTHQQGDAHSIWIDPKTGLYHGAADKRINGKAAGY